MKLLRCVLALFLVGVVTGVAYVAQQNEPAGVKMTAAAERFLERLNAEQKSRATFAFDSKERTNWHFTPQQDAQRKATRKGLPLEDMSEEQKEAAKKLLAAGTSVSGDKKALTIMSLEAILRELEQNGRMVRNPQWYFFSVFGKPSATGKWGWRVEGHHLSLNFVIDGGKVLSATPAFFGANPATVKTGPRKGLRTLPEAEDLARELFLALDEDQRKAAYHEKEFPEVGEEKAAPKVGPPAGLAASKMTDKQRDLLVKLVQTYADRMPPDIGEREMKEVKDAGVENIHFAYNGGTEEGKKHTYRVQGPTFVIEFLNVQADSAGNPANHIHSAWRSLKGDFGLGAE